jgi:diphthamide synthase (EF-2-diphthine--ammonia ligase)
VEPLWGGPAVEVAWAVVERGYRAIVVSAEVARGVAGLLGREFDADLVTEISTRDDIDPCGERGEFHTFVFDGPEFSSPVEFSTGETVELEGRRFVDLVPAGAPSTSKWD